MKTKLPSDRKGFVKRLALPILGEMKETSEFVSRLFLQVRVDFLVAQEGLFITELTFSPSQD